MSALGSKQGFYDPREIGALAERIQSVVDVQGPVHVDEAFRSVARCWGYAGLGSQIKLQLHQALGSIPLDDRPQLLGGKWLWPASMTPRTWRRFRVPGAEQATHRKAEHIPSEEIANAARTILERAIGWVERVELAKETAQLFWIRRLGRNVSACLDAGIEVLAEHCDVDGSRLRLKESAGADV